MGELDELDVMKSARDLIKGKLDQINEGREKDLTHREIAELCGVSQSVVSLYMRGFILEGRLKQVCMFLSWLGIDPTTFTQALGLWKPKATA